MDESTTASTLVAARLKRTLLVLLVVVGAALAGWVVAAGFAILAVFVFFIFSGGKGLDSFMHGFFEPALTFLGGALAFGGVMAVISAVFASGRLWFKTIAIIAVLGGLITVMNPAVQEWLAARVAPANEILKKVLLTPM